MPVSCIVVLPAYNEEQDIARVVKDWQAVLTQALSDAWRILVIDDGSRDATAAILDRIATVSNNVQVCHQPNQGHGGAVMNGYRQAVAMDTDYIFQIDSDNQFDAADFSKLWDRRGQSDFILGFREVRDDALLRKLISQVASLLILALFAVRVKDSNVPYRLMRRDFLQSCLPLVPEGAFAPNICLAIIARRRGQALLHIPVHHRRRAGGRALSFTSLAKGALRSCTDLLRLRKMLS